MVRRNAERGSRAGNQTAPERVLSARRNASAAPPEKFHRRTVAAQLPTTQSFPVAHGQEKGLPSPQRYQFYLRPSTAEFEAGTAMASLTDLSGESRHTRTRSAART